MFNAQSIQKLCQLGMCKASERSCWKCGVMSVKDSKTFSDMAEIFWGMTLAVLLEGKRPTLAERICQGLDGKQ